HQYLTKEIGNPKEVDELIDASSKYVVKQSTQKVIKDKKEAAIRSSTPKETVNDAISSQKNDGSFEISKTITKELNDTSPEDLVKKAQSYVKSDKIKPKNSDSIFKTASSAILEKYKKAREYLSSQIGDKQLEEDVIKTSSKVVINKSSEKIAKASKKEALKEIQITPEITKTIVSTQKTDGSFEVSKEITDKLNSTSPESLVTSVITYTKNDKLKNVKPSVWQDETTKTTIYNGLTDERVEKASNKKKETSWPSLSTSLSSWESGWSKYITDTAKSTTEGILQVAKKTTDSVPEATQPETEPKAEPGWFDNIATTEKANNNHEIEDSRYNTQTYDFSLDDLN
ncbi:hypothetical protein C1646_812335, partial [Rhizophagus diaphanus]